MIKRDIENPVPKADGGRSTLCTVETITIQTNADGSAFFASAPAWVDAAGRIHNEGVGVSFSLPALPEKAISAILEAYDERRILIEEKISEVAGARGDLSRLTLSLKEDPLNEKQRRSAETALSAARETLGAKNAELNVLRGLQAED